MDCCATSGTSGDDMATEICATGTCCVGDSGGPVNRTLSIKTDLNTKYVRTSSQALEYQISAAEAVAGLAAGESLHDYYYAPDAKCSIEWTTSGMPNVPGEMKVTVKVKGEPYVPADDVERQIFTAGLATALTQAEISTEITRWQGLLDRYWNQRAVIITLKKGECLLLYKVRAQIQEVRSGDDRTITFLRSGRATASTPEPLRTPLNNLGRSHARKYNVGDTREGVIPHEYGHWIGWPDEYIEFTGRIKGPSLAIANSMITGGTVLSRRDDDPSTRAAKGVPYETLGSAGFGNRSLRHGLDFDNPTKRFELANSGNARQRIILREGAVYPGLMASGVNGSGSPTRNGARYYYAVAKAFARAYGGGAELYDVVVA